jgi:outer membrane protein OmpA-like peptidoglycan-associated protein
MHCRVWQAIGIGLAVSLATGVTYGATLKNVKGNVLVSAGSGLKSATNGTVLVPGSRVLATSTGSATIAVAAGCDIQLGANQRWTVTAGTNCDSARASVEGVRSTLVAGAQVVPTAAQQTRRSTIVIDASTLFTHDKFVLSDSLSTGRDALDKLASKVDTECTGVDRIVVEGHADITNSTGDRQYNDRLSLARAVTVRDYMASKFARKYNLEAIGFGHTAPVKTSCVYPRGSKLTADGLVQGSASAAQMRELWDCLQPNRRVVVRVEGDALVCALPPVASTQQPVAPPPVASPPPPTPVTPVAPSAPVAAPTIPPPAPAVIAPVATTFPGATVIGTLGAAGLGYYLYDRDRRNVSPN